MAQVDVKDQKGNVFLFVWTGETEKAVQVVSRFFPGRNIEVISRRQMWDGGWRGQARTLHACRGEAFVYFFRSLEEMRQPALIAASGLIHSCSKNLIIDVQGKVTRMTCVDLLTLLPKTVGAVLYEA